MRSFGNRGSSMKVVTRLIGTLFLRTVERAERIYSAMLSRGFNGDIPSLKAYQFRLGDGVYISMTIAVLSVFRFFPVTDMLGRFVQEILP